MSVMLEMVNFTCYCMCEKLPVKREAPCLYKLELELIHLYFWNAIIKRKISKFEANI